MLNLLSGSHKAPAALLAGLRVENGGYLLALATLATEESLCGGRAVVPNIYSMPINTACSALSARGWTPVDSEIGSDCVELRREPDPVERSNLEVENCSGTSFGYCAYGSRGPVGTLSVATIGNDEFATVSGKSATCR